MSALELEESDGNHLEAFLAKIEVADEEAHAPFSDESHEAMPARSDPAPEYEPHKATKFHQSPSEDRFEHMPGQLQKAPRSPPEDRFKHPMGKMPARYDRAKSDDNSDKAPLSPTEERRAKSKSDKEFRSVSEHGFESFGGRR